MAVLSGFRRLALPLLKIKSAFKNAYKSTKKAFSSVKKIENLCTKIPNQ
jgi:hypothetical protein